MHIEQQHKMQLAELLSKQIIDGINSNTPNYLPLIKIAKEQELFFPEMNWSLFTMGLSKSFSWEQDLVAKNYNLFKVNSIQAGKLYHDTVEVQLYNFLFSKSNGNLNLINNNSKMSDFLLPKFTRIVEFGLVLPEEFFTSSTVTQFMSSEHLKALQDLNLHNYLDTTIANKSGAASKVKI